jgi:hypothetical protein
VHLIWLEQIKRKKYEQVLSRRKYNEIAMRAARIETKTNLLFSFDKMALQDAIKTPAGAKDFAKGLYHYVLLIRKCTSVQHIVRLSCRKFQQCLANVHWKKQKIIRTYRLIN